MRTATTTARPGRNSLRSLGMTALSTAAPRSSPRTACVQKTPTAGATGDGESVVRSRGVEPPHVTTIPGNDLPNQPETGGAECGALSADSAILPSSAPPSLPPDVADLARRLAALPESVRASLLAAVKAAVPAKAAGPHEWGGEAKQCVGVALRPSWAAWRQSGRGSSRWSRPVAPATLARRGRPDNTHTAWTQKGLEG